MSSAPKFNLSDAKSVRDCMHHASAAIIELIPRKLITFTLPGRTFPAAPSAAAYHSDAVVRMTVYGFTLAALQCCLARPDFDKHPSYEALLMSFSSRVTVALEARYKGLPSEQAKSMLAADGSAMLSFTLSLLDLYREVQKSFEARDKLPFTHLFRFLHQDLQTSPADLDARYGPLTRKLLKEMR